MCAAQNELEPFGLNYCSVFYLEHLQQFDRQTEAQYFFVLSKKHKKDLNTLADLQKDTHETLTQDLGLENAKVAFKKDRQRKNERATAQRQAFQREQQISRRRESANERANIHR